MQSEKLKPCPFCGHSATIDQRGDHRMSTIYQCDNCGCRLETGEERDYGAEWNRRAEAALSAAEPQSAPSVAVKALEWVEGQHLGVNYEAKTAFGIYRVFRMHKAEGWIWSFSSDVDSNAHTPNYPNGEAASADEAKSAAQADYEARIHSALSAQVQDVAGTVEAFDRDHPELYWHVAKGKATAGEPLYGSIITDLRGTELGHGESDVSAVDAFNIAVSALPAALAKQEG